MNRDGHVATGALSGAGTAAACGVGVLPMLGCIAIGAAAALLPDIDHHGSTITRTLGPLGTLLSWCARKTSLGVYMITKSRADTPAAGGEHRGLTHTAVAAAGAGAALWVLLNYAGATQPLPYALALAVGLVTHIVGDGLTAQGVPLFWPLPISGERWYGWHVPMITIRCGGPAEKTIAGLSWIATAALLLLAVGNYLPW